MTDLDSATSSSNGARLVSTDGRALPLVATQLRADARGGVARVVLEQTFRNPHDEPLAVTYALPLPADGAVSGFAFTIGNRRVVGEVDRKGAARERYEQALSEGRSAALLEQDRSSLFTQEIGNIPPRAEVVCEVTVDQRLRWLDEGAWEWRFPTVVAPRYLGAPGRVPDAAKVTQDVADGPLAVRMAFACVVRDELHAGRRPESPSHRLAVTELRGGGVSVGLEGTDGARLDRDVVVRWPVVAPRVGLSLEAGRGPAGARHGEYAHALLTVVPPDGPTARRRPVARDLIVLLDTSGSMSGEPLAQARRVVSALVETLGERDQLEMIEFSSAPRRWKPGAVRATEGARREALAWLAALRASGGTEMRAGILEALRPLRAESQRQIVLVTDGLIGFESEVVAAVCDGLPRGSRLHTVGVGSSVNRSLTGPAARAGHGVEVVIGLGEDPERAARRLVARTDAPVLVDLELSGSALLAHVPIKLPDLFAGAPALIALKLAPEGGELRVRGRTAEGSWEQRLRAPALAPGEGAPWTAALFAREAVEDLEMRLGAGAWAREVDPQIEQLGLDYQIATRLTSWVAVTREVMVDPGDPLRRERMPHELPHGMSAEGVGLRPAAAVAAAAGELDADEEVADHSVFAPQPLEAPAAEYQLRAERAKDKLDASSSSRQRMAPPLSKSSPPAARPAPMPPLPPPAASRPAPLPSSPASASRTGGMKRHEASPPPPPPAARAASASPSDQGRVADKRASLTGAPAKPVSPSAPPTMPEPAAPPAFAAPPALSVSAPPVLPGAPAAGPSANAPYGAASGRASAAHGAAGAGDRFGADEEKAIGAGRVSSSYELDDEFEGSASTKKEASGGGGGGVLGAVKRFFGLGSSEKSEEPVERELARRSPAPKAAAAAPSTATTVTATTETTAAAAPAALSEVLDALAAVPGARTLRGRVAVQREPSGARTLVVTALVDAAGELAWAPGAQVELEFDDGTRATATVDAARTTPAGQLAVGLTARLTLTLAAGAPTAAPRRIVLRGPAGQVIIELA